MYDFGKRAAALAAFVVFATALVPLWMPGQTALEYRMNSQNDALIELRHDLHTVPSDIAVLKSDILQLREEQKSTSSDVQQIRTAAFTSTAGMLVFLASWLFNLFGGRALSKQRETVKQ